MTNWLDVDSQVTAHFSVRDCIYLHLWNRLAKAEDGLSNDMLRSITATCLVMEQVREFLGCPMNVHSFYRSPAYNAAIGAPAHDVHAQGLAIDLDLLPHMTTDDAKEKLQPVLEKFHIRMEDNGKNSSWIHLDCAPLIYKRFFKP
jgi:hypothetical protein